ncbi:formate dehydrogenase subunit alpha [Parachitinimonas caeni]|uniref:Formate dehydrogenase subunit alpha n=1 Tax=Parachitinimonas caeni TaxID=3031301 RepID=A0ABT7E3F7_9NEIS|nr:formate dehydrogenase subunit alpha [Parachitinimonas caeni]MDK2126838.1 formate dehydrogenase subunit alpha [Parachitinimonas caeni]
MAKIVVDGVDFSVAEGTLLLKALEAAGHAVPHLCHDDRLKPHGGCRLCLVEVAGDRRPVASCNTVVCDGMVVQTQTPLLQTLRATNLSLLAARYPADALTAEPQHPFHQLLAGCPTDSPAVRRAVGFHDESHPYIGTSLDRCIQCERCVRICDEVQGQFVWASWQRGEQTHIAPNHGSTLLEAGCVACGACVDTCPTGALFDKRSQTAVENWTRSTCVYCGVGCQMEVGTANGQVVQIKPAASPVNRGHLCVKGRYAYEFGTADDRISEPMLRRDGTWQPVSWDEAFDFIASRLAAIRQQYGADAIGVLGSARATNEENYLAQKFARVVLGTNNIDCCARVCHTPSAKALKLMLGTGAATNAFDDIEHTQLLMLSGCNPTENHPVVGARIKQAVRRGAKLIVIDPRRTELAAMADLHLAVRPGHNVELYNAMAATVVEEGLLDADFIANRVDGLAEFSQFVRDYAPEAVAASCGVPAGLIRSAARLYAGAKPAMCFHGLGLTEHVQGTEGVMAQINLALLTGNLGKRGAGINPLRGQNNVQGSAQMGCDPATLTGAQSFVEAGAHFKSLWGASLPASHGLDLLSMLDAARAGRFKALWAVGYDIYPTLAHVAETAQALAALELVIVQDLFLTETAKAFGTVFLPAASVFERDGTFMNSDRRVQRVRQAIKPPGNAQPDWWIIQTLAQRMGHQTGFDFDGPEAIWNEVRQLWPAGAGLSYARLEHESLNWPCPDEAHPGTPVLHIDRFASGPRATLACLPFTPSPEQPSQDYPFVLVTGRTLYHFNAGTLSYRTPNARLRPSDTLDMSPQDARRLLLNDGEPVRIRSRYGEAVLPLRISPTIKPGELFATFHRPDLWVNRLTSSYRDNRVNSPEYKRTAVTVEPVFGGGN